MSWNTIEIGGHTNSGAGKALSNFFARSFVFDGVRCAGFEGIIQALKCPDPQQQRELCKLSGKEAKKAGAAYDSWKNKKVLYWQGTTYKRNSRSYMLLITRIYNAIYDQDPTYREHLLALGNADIWHSIGNPDMNQTTLTEVEMLFQIERLRRRALQETIAALVSVREI